MDNLSTCAIDSPDPSSGIRSSELPTHPFCRLDQGDLGGWYLSVWSYVGCMPIHWQGLSGCIGYGHLYHRVAGELSLFLK